MQPPWPTSCVVASQLNICACYKNAYYMVVPTNFLNINIYIYTVLHTGAIPYCMEYSANSTIMEFSMCSEGFASLHVFDDLEEDE